jgi:hypothetical protein
VVRWARMAHVSSARRWLTFELSGRHRCGPAKSNMVLGASRGHAGGGPRSSEGLGLTERTQAEGRFNFGDQLVRCAMRDADLGLGKADLCE